jgi:hypothetical protein
MMMSRIDAATFDRCGMIEACFQCGIAASASEVRHELQR